MSDLVAAPPRLGFGSKVAYGSGSMAFGVASQALSTSIITLYLNQVIGLPAPLVGTAIMVSLIVDAFIDPVIGRWSDSIKTPWGRRHPFMYAAAVPCALAFYVLWHPPTEWPAQSLAIFMFVLLVIVRISVSFFEIPNSALAPELAPDYHERTSLLAIRWFFGIFGVAAMIMLLYSVFLRRDADHPLGILNKAGYGTWGTIAAGVMFATVLTSSLVTHRLIPFLSHPARRQLGLGETVREVLATIGHPSLLVLLMSGIVGGLGTGVTQTLNSYFYLHLWGLKPQTISILILILAPAAIAGAVLAPIVSRRFGKKHAMIGLFSVSTVTSLIPLSFRLLGWMPPNDSPWLLPILFGDAFVAAVLGLMGFILISSMIADVAEDNAVRTGVRSEGVLFAANGLIPKITTGVGAFIGTLLLQAAMFPPHAQQGTVPVATMLHLAMLYLPLSATMSTIAIGVLIFYRIDQATHERNLATLREAAAAAEIGQEAGVETGLDAVNRVI
jgi:GPH family glycoside/pentoside/hexuronide:cation symporter